MYLVLPPKKQNLTSSRTVAGQTYFIVCLLNISLSVVLRFARKLHRSQRPFSFFSSPRKVEKHRKKVFGHAFRKIFELRYSILTLIFNLNISLGMLTLIFYVPKILKFITTSRYTFCGPSEQSGVPRFLSSTLNKEYFSH